MRGNVKLASEPRFLPDLTFSQLWLLKAKDEKRLPLQRGGNNIK